MIICPFCQQPIIFETKVGTCTGSTKFPHPYSKLEDFEFSCLVQLNELESDYLEIAYYELDIPYNNKKYGFDSYRTFYKNTHTLLMDLNPSFATLVELPSYTPLEQSLETFQRLMKLRAFL